MISLQSPPSPEVIKTLKAGDEVLLSGIILTARDAAHKKLCDLLDEGKHLPVELTGQTIYYAGPSPTPPGKLSGSVGPTTSSRMDAYTPALIEKTGVRALIGKGNRNSAVVESIKKYKCVYFAALGGAGALIGTCVQSSQVVCFEELGPEAIYKLEVKDLYLIVAIDSTGRNLYER
jgi:fumarate hydratase subunit beta